MTTDYEYRMKEWKIRAKSNAVFLVDIKSPSNVDFKEALIVLEKAVQSAATWQERDAFQIAIHEVSKCVTEGMSGQELNKNERLMKEVSDLQNRLDQIRDLC